MVAISTALSFNWCSTGKAAYQIASLITTNVSTNANNVFFPFQPIKATTLGIGPTNEILSFPACSIQLLLWLVLLILKVLPPQVSSQLVGWWSPHCVNQWAEFYIKCITEHSISYQHWETVGWISPMSTESYIPWVGAAWACWKWFLSSFPDLTSLTVLFQSHILVLWNPSVTALVNWWCVKPCTGALVVCVVTALVYLLTQAHGVLFVWRTWRLS